MDLNPNHFASYGLNSSVIAKLPNGEVASGRVSWLNSQSMQLELNQCLNPTDLLELRVELQGLDETVYIQAAVARSRPPAQDRLASTIVRIIDMPLQDKELLERWVEDHSFGGTSSNPGSLLSLSSARRGGGRSSVREGLRQALQLHESKS